MTDKQLDPRYDPAFQPGFDGRVVPGLTRRQEPRSPDAGSTPTIEPLRAAPRATAQPDPYAPHDDFLTAMRQAASTDPARLPEPAAAAAPRPAWRNPFLIAVAIVGLALIAGGISGMTAAYDQRGVSATEAPYVFLVFMQLGGPMLVVLGVATLIGVGFFLAVHWQRARR